jgi:RNA polymerase sigma-B factor
LFRRYRLDREPAVRDALIARFMTLARYLARRYPVAAEREDLTQVAALALITAVDRFDPERGSAFASFATPTILGEIKRYFRDHGWTMRVPRQVQDLNVRVERITQPLVARLGRAPTAAEVAVELDVDEEQVLEAILAGAAHHPEPLETEQRDGDGPPRNTAAVEEAGYGLAEDAATVDVLLDHLPLRDRLVVELRFRHELTQREIAELVGISQMQVSRVLTRSITTLREFAEAPAGLAAAD